MTAAYELRNDTQAQTMLADWEVEPGAEAEAVGPAEAGAEQALAAAGEHW